MSKYIRLEEEVPVFPLPQTILFPNVVLPLHIFEQRYRDLLNDSLDKKGLFCLAIISSGWDGIHEKDFPFYPLCALCQIEKYNKLNDGRFNLLVKGIERVLVEDLEYRTQKSYKTVRVKEIYPSLEEKIDQSLENEIRQVATSFFKSQPTSSSQEEITNFFHEMSLIQILNVLCSHAPTEIQEKYAIFNKHTSLEVCDALLGLYSNFRA